MRAVGPVAETDGSRTLNADGLRNERVGVDKDM